MESEFDRKVAALVKKEPRYQSEAYYFVSEAVNFTVARLERSGHVSAGELLDGIRDFTLGKFGAVGSIVLNDWGLIAEADAGEVVYLLIGVGLLRASEDDRPEDFNTGRPLFLKLPTYRSVRRRSDVLPFIDD